MHAIIVRDIMKTDVKTIASNASVKEAVVKMERFNIGSIVVSDNGNPVGILTETDIVRRVVARGFEPYLTPVKHVMTSPLVTIDQNATIEEAARVMTEKRVKKLPVLGDNSLVGIVTTTDLVQVQPSYVGLLEELASVGETAIKNKRPRLKDRKQTGQQICHSCGMYEPDCMCANVTLPG